MKAIILLVVIIAGLFGALIWQSRKTGSYVGEVAAEAKKRREKEEWMEKYGKVE